MSTAKTQFALPVSDEHRWQRNVAERRQRIMTRGAQGRAMHCAQLGACNETLAHRDSVADLTRDRWEDLRLAFVPRRGAADHAIFSSIKIGRVRLGVAGATPATPDGIEASNDFV